jgi:hypothetical protein
MNANLIGFAVALALLGSTNLFAGQNFGRDSVYATPGTYSAQSSTVADITLRFGRSSVYVGDVRAPRTPSTVANSVTVKAGGA